MLAAALAAVATLEVVLPGKHDETFIAVVVISFFQFGHAAKLNNVELKPESLKL